MRYAFDYILGSRIDIILETFGAHLKLNACACGQHVT